MQKTGNSDTALLIVDLQNDFLHADGAYGRAGVQNDAIAALPDLVLPVVDAVRQVGGWVVSTQFTLVPGRNGVPFISPHLSKLRPFLSKGDFQSGAWGHALVDSLQPADLSIEKVAYSAFYMTRMEWVLRKANVGKLIVCGIVTNGGVASTVRDAHVRDFDVTVLSDGCAAFTETSHQQALSDMASIVSISDCSEIISKIG